MTSSHQICCTECDWHEQVKKSIGKHSEIKLVRASPHTVAELHGLARECGFECRCSIRYDEANEEISVSHHHRDWHDC